MHGENQPPAQTPHLAPALTAVILVVVALAAFGIYARSLERRSIKALAADQAIIDRDGKLSPLLSQGSALQQAALETAGLLPIYGSSELNLQVPYTRPFHPTNLFHDYPTGFTIFPVGKAETTCLIILQKLAALGPALEGRKLAVSLSPFWFYKRPGARSDSYAGNFSPLHAGELAFNTRLSLPLRQDAARRMLKFPATLANRAVLRFALENLADGSPLGLACYAAVLPLGITHNEILRYQDHWNAVSYLWTHPPERISSPNSARSGQQIDWPILYQQADVAYRPHCSNNELGLDNQTWDHRLRQEMLRQRNSQSDETFLRTLERNMEWADLELLLRELTEIGAQPLLLSMPIHGGWYDQCGVTYAARMAYYQKLRAISARYHIAVLDFADHDSDQSFCHDHMGHLAPSGLVHYGQVLDGFFHDSTPRQCELPGRGLNRVTKASTSTGSLRQ
jgi:D-alanine transfer protein